MNKKNLLGLDEAELQGVVGRLGHRPYRGKQLFQQLYCHRQLDLERMTELSKALRWHLQESFEVQLPQIDSRQESRDGTVKFLFRLADGRRIESVSIPEPKRTTACISSQAGCGVGCTFCMTAQMGFQRNLSAGEMVGQLMAMSAQGCLPEKGFNVVFMGMGEPLYNYRNVMKAFRLMTDARGLGLSQHRITVSTSGVVPVLKRMLREPRLPNLAISLNATTDPVRDRLMPLNRKWNLGQLLKVCARFPRESRHRITFEYILLRGINDSDQDARQLVRLLSGLPARVNLIPCNPNPGLPYRRSTPDRMEKFQQLLRQASVSAFVRKTRGQDIAAACGQLAHLGSEVCA